MLRFSHNLLQFALDLEEMATNASARKEHTYSVTQLANQHLHLPTHKDRWKMQQTTRCNRWILKQMGMGKIIR